MARSLPHPTTRWVAGVACWLVLLLAACSDPAPAPGTIPPDTGAQPGSPATPAETSGIRIPAQWTVSELSAPRGFRAFGWGAGDTIWGIARGRHAMASLAGDSLVAREVTWGAGTAPGHDLAWWTGEDGLFVRRDGQPGRVTAATPPTAEHLGPQVLWSPDGTRALLTWSAESGPVHTVIEPDSQRRLGARLPGYSLGAGMAWLDPRRVIVAATAHGPVTGTGGHREAGYRGDLAVLDVGEDHATRVTTVADGEFLVPEGLLHPDTLLVGVRREGGVERHMALDTRSWTLTPRLGQGGRAAAAHGIIALLEPVPGPGEPAYRLSIQSATSSSGPLATVQGHDVRLLWHPLLPVLAVAIESEAAGGMRTLIVR